jgi:hypothetical protein
MNGLRKILLLCVSSLVSVCSLTQVEVGGWRVHASFNNVQNVAQSADRVFGVSDGSLFLFDKKDYEVETLSKVLADYTERLKGVEIPISIPDTVLIACWSFVQMHGDSDVGRAAKYWYDALTRTDSTRVSLGGSIVP